MNGKVAKNLKKITSGYRSEIISLFLYTLLAAVFTYPLIFKFNTSIYGYPSDSLATVWNFWRWFIY